MPGESGRRVPDPAQPPAQPRVHLMSPPPPPRPAFAVPPAVSRTLLLVESPNKAKKIQAFLGREGVTVRASVGHICDLPQKGYGVDLTSFEESYEVRNAKVVGELRQLVRSKQYERVLLATDPDREGEAIAWHLARELKLSQR